MGHGKNKKKRKQHVQEEGKETLFAKGGEGVAGFSEKYIGCEPLNWSFRWVIRTEGVGGLTEPFPPPLLSPCPLSESGLTYHVMHAAVSHLSGCC